MMFQCYICNQFEATVTKFRAHIYRHSGCGELVLPVRCRQGKCLATFSTVFNLFRHLMIYHRVESISETLLGTDNGNIYSTDNNSSTRPTVDLDHDSVCDDQVQVNSHATGRPNADDYLRDVHTEAVSLIAGLRANSSIPYSVLPNIVESFNHMATSMMSFAGQVVENCINETNTGIDETVLTNLKTDIDEKLGKVHEPLSFLATVYKQDKYFNNHELFVKPESTCFGSRFESHSGTSKLVYDSFQYVSVEKSLRSLLHNKQYVEALLYDKRQDGVYVEFSDGEAVLEHPLFSRSGKLSIMLQLFYDGLGTTNPLRGQNTLHNIGVFFYTIKNLPSQYNCCFANVHLLALCYTEDLKVYGFKPVLEKFVAEIKFLQEKGMEIDLPILGSQHVYASLCQVTCDNLALNSMLGFIESFSCDFFCTMCYAKQDMIQKCFRSEMFQKRTVAEYNVDVSDVSDAVGKIHVRGVKRYCILNEIEGYHVTQNYGLDVMHIVVEGIVPFELGCILFGLSVENKIVNIDTVNSDLAVFWGQMTVSKGDKPSYLHKLSEAGHGLSPSMKAVQYLALLKFLPLAIGRRVPHDNVHWKFLLHLSHLVDLLLAPRFTRGMVIYLKDVIEDHLSNFSSLYSAKWDVKLRPKHHLLVHLPSVILQSGPLIGMSCMKYEMKNSFFKRSAHTVSNFTNICSTLAKRHQQRALFDILSGSHIRNVVTAGHQLSVPLCTLSYCDLVCEKFGVESTDDILVADKVSLASVVYMCGNCVLVEFDFESGDPVFGKILSFVCVGTAEWNMVVQILHTYTFYRHFHAFCIKENKPTKYKLCRIQDLADHHPLHCYSMIVNRPHELLKFIRLPYHIFS
jgi:hypothetical protein